MLEMQTITGHVHEGNAKDFDSRKYTSHSIEDLVLQSCVQGTIKKRKLEKHLTHM